MLYLMVGIPASGKSTIAKKLEQEKGIIRVSRDDIRFKLLKENNITSNKHYFDYEDEVIKTYYDTIERKLKEGYDVCGDATHLTLKARQKLIQQFKKYGVSAIYCPILPKVALNRNSVRQEYKKVPNEVIIDMSKRLTVPNLDEGFENIFINGLDKKLIG